MEGVIIMITYFIIGIIVQLVILIERVIRIPGLCRHNNEGWQYWVGFWATIIVGSTINVLVWPLTIICEIINIAHGE